MEKDKGGLESCTLGERLATLRKKYGYSQQDIADMLGRHQTDDFQLGVRAGGADS